MQQLRQVDLTTWHTLAARAQADCILLIESEDELPAIMLGDHILGGGSNTLFVGDITQRLVQLKLRGRKIVNESAMYLDLCVAAGESWADLACDTANDGLLGLENLAAIPGTVGAAPVQNIGAYGVECGERIVMVRVWDRQSRQFIDLTAKQCEFSYRNSRFKRDWQNKVIVSVTFRLAKTGSLNTSYPGLQQAGLTTPSAVHQAVMMLRQEKLPDVVKEPNAGSFFHNPIISKEKFSLLKQHNSDIPHYVLGVDQIKLSAAWLIEACGLKGVYDGAVGMSEKHALVLINRGGSGEEILRFAQNVQQTVYGRFGVNLLIEPIIVGVQSWH